MPTLSGYDREQFGRILRSQYEVVSRSQALECGMTRGTIEYRLRPGGPWRQILPAVYLTVTGTATADQRDAAKAKVTDLSSQAVAQFQEAQKAAPEKDPNVHLFWARMGEAYDLAGRNDEAINAYQQAVAAKPDNAGYYNNLGNVLARAGKIEEAKAAYTKSAELDPPNAALAWRNFGISLYQAGRMTEAIEPLQKATQIDPKNAQGWYLLGTCMVADPSIYKQVGDKIEVSPKPGTAEAFQKAIDLDPNGPIGAQAKQGLEQLNQLTGGIETKVGGKKKKS